jgi:4'-phosphopantetheinyl transferase EntD
MPDGLCVAVRLPDSGRVDVTIPTQELHPAEVEQLDSMLQTRKVNFVGGRLALRRALYAVGSGESAQEPLLPDPSGAPRILGEALGSISHTTGLAAAFVSLLQPENGQHGTATTSRSPSKDAQLRAAVGVDVECATREVALKIAKRVLAEEERRTLGASAELPSARDLLLRVSIKEALYKALHPLVRQPIRWHSVRVQPDSVGSCAVDITRLEAQIGVRLEVKASWCVHEGYFLSVARAAMLPH